MAKIEEFTTREEMTIAALAAAEATLRDGLSARGEASCALSGGSTPLPLYEAMSRLPLDWPRVHVTLADERQAEEGSGARNDALVRKHLMRGPAADATFRPLIGADTVPAPQPFDLVVLGMGEDAHTASLFPLSPGLSEALSAPADAVVEVTPDPLPEDAPYPRLTLSRAGILGARLVLLLITGEKKRAVLEDAMRQGQVETAPVRAVLHAKDVRLRVMYAE